MEYTYSCRNEEELIALGEVLGSLLNPKDVIAMEGDLGAGKTTFTKGIAKGLGVTKVVNSPTFTIVKEYNGRMPLYHMDVYRLEESDEDLGFDEYFYGDGVSIVEWAHLIEDYLPSERLTIHLYYEEVGRKIVLSPSGTRYHQLCEELKHECARD
ncbi:tRNA (adenosine(37)-N6)-threonylcarbamoyltransferase complex ATPase subunit type 1 TsaE [Bacillus carboniphilus]|uniref:tRNA threonylcarbamoyladenosine biosynthesis protein TsaE n=1 Tax=Bacillus carboniphilus TaxID=86663 RepID=A0ABP3FQX1_9BACI